MRDDYEKTVKRLREAAERTSNSLNTRDICRNAANAIEEMQKALDAVNDAHNEGFDVGYWAGRRDYEPKWIPVTERLPEPFVSVLVYMPLEAPFETVREGFLTKSGFWHAALFDSVSNEVTYWMPLPEPPKEETSDG